MWPIAMGSNFTMTSGLGREQFYCINCSDLDYEKGHTILTAEF